MKIAVCTQSDQPTAVVDSRFGRAGCFAVFDKTTEQWNFIPNHQNLQAAHGAGIQAAQAVIDAHADILIASSVGPKAMAALQSNGISVFMAKGAMTAEQAVNEYLAGNLAHMQQPNVEGHWM